MILANISKFVYEIIERRSNCKYYEIKLSFMLVFLTCFFSTPMVFYFFFQEGLPSAWETVMLKSVNLTDTLDHIEPYSWQAKKVFRLTIPVLIKLFHLPPYIIISFQILVGYLLFLFSYRLAFRISKDSIQATLITSGFAFLYFGKASIFEYQYAWFDGFSYFFLIMAMYSRNIYSIIFFSTLAAWNDERAFIALSFVFLFQFFENFSTNKMTIKDLFNVNKNAIAVLIAIFFYIFVRLVISYYFNMLTPHEGVGLNIIFRTYSFIPIGLLTFFEGFYILLAVFFIFMIKSSDYLRSFFISVPLLIMTVVSFCVTDITRSGSFALPIVFIAIHFLKNKICEKEMRAILLICLLISFIIPPVFICVDWSITSMLTKPSLIRMLEYVLPFIKNYIL
jgi:hypothetical protein